MKFKDSVKLLVKNDEDSEDLPIIATSGFVAVKRCKAEGQRLEIGDSVPQNWPKLVIEDLLACKAVKAN